MAGASGAPSRTPTRASSPQAWCCAHHTAAGTDAPTQGVANNAQGEGMWLDANEALAAFKDTEFNSVCVITVCGRDAKVAIAVQVEKQFCWSSAST